MERIKTVLVASAIILLVAMAFYLIHIFKESEAEVYTNKSINITPAQIKSIKDIGQWEFLAIEDEEMVDTVRKGFFSDDNLIIIYPGTLRLGFDMKNVPGDWISSKNDTVNITLPRIALLNQEFINEAQAKVFYETGKWSDKDRNDLYRRALARMKTRGLTQSNIKAAEHNAEAQFKQIMGAMGFAQVNIKWTEKR